MRSSEARCALLNALPLREMTAAADVAGGGGGGGTFAVGCTMAGGWTAGGGTAPRADGSGACGTIPSLGEGAGRGRGTTAGAPCATAAAGEAAPSNAPASNALKIGAKSCLILVSGLLDAIASGRLWRFGGR